jgi:hypothetical protein
VTNFNTPEINSKFAVPFKIVLVETQEPFKEIYSATRSDIKTLSGKTPTYKEERGEEDPFLSTGHQLVQVRSILKYVCLVILYRISCWQHIIYI